MIPNILIFPGLENEDDQRQVENIDLHSNDTLIRLSWKQSEVNESLIK